ncbi:MAG: hypothetical protein V1798_12165 [Pseudomonadota bacterium]
MTDSSSAKFGLPRIFFALLVFALMASCSSKRETGISAPSTQGQRGITQTTQNAPAVAALEKICGNGLVEDAEECDGGACCTRNCRLIPVDWNVVCDPVAGTICSGSTADCATNRLTEIQPGVRAFNQVRGVIP